MPRSLKTPAKERFVMEFGTAGPPTSAGNRFLGTSPLSAIGTVAAGADTRRHPGIADDQTFIIKRMRYRARLAPGGGVTDTYRLQVNNTSVGSALTIAGAAQTTGVVPLGVRVKATDLVQILVTSTAAPSAAVNITIRLEGEVAS